MLSGHVGNRSRVNAIMDFIKNAGSGVIEENESGVHTSPVEYMNKAREEHRKRKYSTESTDTSKPGPSKLKGVHYKSSIK